MRDAGAVGSGCALRAKILSFLHFLPFEVYDVFRLGCVSACPFLPPEVCLLLHVFWRLFFHRGVNVFRHVVHVMTSTATAATTVALQPQSNRQNFTLALSTSLSLPIYIVDTIFVVFAADIVIVLTIVLIIVLIIVVVVVIIIDTPLWA